ncbi:hypothetical protein PR048_023127 [Dryococelus australis]|uniref:Uncharacterized protein n=1 Tax=Dryococelus australis TaxID=614101 RepID=A0ABQ9GT86_9NEOP|nr:hypothetical protein PR048_023127 [Dryococelus australis]
MGGEHTNRSAAAATAGEVQQISLYCNRCSSAALQRSRLNDSKPSCNQVEEGRRCSVRVESSVMPVVFGFENADAIASEIALRPTANRIMLTTEIVDAVGYELLKTWIECCLRLQPLCDLCVVGFDNHTVDADLQSCVETITDVSDVIMGNSVPCLFLLFCNWWKFVAGFAGLSKRHPIMSHTRSMGDKLDDQELNTFESALCNTRHVYTDIVLPEENITLTLKERQQNELDDLYVAFTIQGSLDMHQRRTVNVDYCSQYILPGVGPVCHYRIHSGCCRCPGRRRTRKRQSLIPRQKLFSHHLSSRGVPVLTQRGCCFYEKDYRFDIKRGEAWRRTNMAETSERTSASLLPKANHLLPLHWPRTAPSNAALRKTCPLKIRNCFSDDCSHPRRLLQSLHCQFKFTHLLPYTSQECVSEEIPGPPPFTTERCLGEEQRFASRPHNLSQPTPHATIDTRLLPSARQPPLHARYRTESMGTYVLQWENFTQSVLPVSMCRLQSVMHIVLTFTQLASTIQFTISRDLPCLACLSLILNSSVSFTDSSAVTSIFSFADSSTFCSSISSAVSFALNFALSFALSSVDSFTDSSAVRFALSSTDSSADSFADSSAFSSAVCKPLTLLHYSPCFTLIDTQDTALIPSETGWLLEDNSPGSLIPLTKERGRPSSASALLQDRKKMNKVVPAYRVNPSYLCIRTDPMHGLAAPQPATLDSSKYGESGEGAGRGITITLTEPDRADFRKSPQFMDGEGRGVGVCGLGSTARVCDLGRSTPLKTRSWLVYGEGVVGLGATTYDSALDFLGLKMPEIIKVDYLTPPALCSHSSESYVGEVVKYIPTVAIVLMANHLFTMECSNLKSNPRPGFASRVGRQEVQCWDMETGCAQPAISVYLITSLVTEMGDPRENLPDNSNVRHVSISGKEKGMLHST